MAQVSARKAAGAYYTPPEVVRYIVAQTLWPLTVSPADPSPQHAAGSKGPSPHILDPACGDGEFLVAAFRWLVAWAIPELRELPEHGRPVHHSDEDACESRIRLIERHLFGVDIDRQAVIAARHRLARLALNLEERTPASAGIAERVAKTAGRFATNIRCGDTLLDEEAVGRSANSQLRPPSCPRPPGLFWRRDFASVFARPASGFDAIVGNPPYINVRVLTKSRGMEVNRYFRSRYRCAQGAFDVYALFIERAFELLRPGGMCGMIVPNKIATLDYAAACRTLLTEQTTLRQVTDLTDRAVFRSATVFPYVLVWQKQPPPPEHRVDVRVAPRSCDLMSVPPAMSVSQRSLAEARSWRLHGFLDIESRVPTQPLAACTTISTGTTGFAANRLAEALIEHAEARGRDGFEFIVSGNIDRYSVRKGNVQFMRRRFERPLLPFDGAPLSQTRLRLFSGAKIVLAGMTRRIEAAFDAGGLALGVQVYAAAAFAEAPQYLLALLNSKLLSFLFRQRYQAKQLAGGYLAVNKSQLASLPIRYVLPVDAPAVALRAEIIQLVGDYMAALGHPDETPPADATAAHPPGETRPPGPVSAIDRRIDALVYELYGLEPREVSQIEAAVADVRSACTS